MRKLKNILTAFLLGFAVYGFAQADGEYYLYDANDEQFLSRGAAWGTEASVDKYGIPFYWNSTEGSIKFKDNGLYLFNPDTNGGTSLFTDNQSTGFRFVETEGGYYLQDVNTNGYATFSAGDLGLYVHLTSEVESAVVWQFKTKAERDEIVAGYVNQNYENVIKAAGLSISAEEFITTISKGRMIDMTSAIGTARFSGNVGNWLYTEVRGQGGQPAYGNDFCELWQATGKHTQTITGLKSGIYKVTVNGFERAAGWAKCNELAAEGYEIVTSSFHANLEQTALKSWYSGKSGDSNPNNTGEAVAKFNEGNYQNELYVYVEEDGLLELAVDKRSHVGDNWILFNNFTLTYFDFSPLEVANIAELSSLEAGTIVKLALNDAKVTLWSGAGQSMATYVEDATGAITFDMGLSNAFETIKSNVALNGYIYAEYKKDWNGMPTLSVTAETEKSSFTVSETTIVPTETTIANILAANNVYKYFNLTNVQVEKVVVDQWGTTELKLIQGTDTITMFDQFNLFGWNGMPDYESFDYISGILSMYDGKFEFYPYGEYKGNIRPSVSVNNIAQVKELKSGTPVKLTLNNAKITANTFGGRSMFTVIEDESGAIQLSGNMAIEGIQEKAVLNGTLYAKYVNEWGSIMLDLSDSTQYSQFTSDIAETIKPRQTAIFKNIDNDEILRFVELKYLNIVYDSTSYCYLAVQAQDTIQIVDNFFKLPFDENTYETIMPEALESMTGFITYNGETYQFYPYTHGESPIVEYVATEPNFEIETYAIQEGETHASGESVELENLTITFGEEGGAEFKAGKADATLAGFPAFTEGNGTNGNKAGGTFYTFVPKKSGQLCVAVILNSNKAFYVEEDGKALENFNGFKTTDKFYGCYTFDVKEGSTYKVYCAGSKLGFYGCIFSYETLTTGGVNYALAEGDAPKSGDVIELDNITLTYGEAGGADFKAATADSQVEGYTACTAGNGTNGNKAGGTFYTLKPALNGQISVAVVLNSGKAFYIEEDGKALENFNGIKVDEKYYGTYTFDVKAGSTYKIYCAGSKLGFYGFSYVFINSKRAPIAPEATGIKDINCTIEQSNGIVYSINGTVVRKAGESLNGLAKGLYIINGKKVIVK